MNARLIASLPLGDFDPHIPGEVLVAGNRLFALDRGRLLAISLNGPTLEWQSAHVIPHFSRYRVPRRLRAWGRRLWSTRDLIVELVDTDDGVEVIGRDQSSGELRWRREFPTPPPAPWAESEPAFDGAETEELGAFLAVSDALVVGVARTTRCSMTTGHPLPPFHAQLDLSRVADSDGGVLWTTSFVEAHVPISEKSRFTSWLSVGRDVVEVDWATGARRRVAEISGLPSWPRRVGRQLLVPSRSRGAVAVNAFGAESGESLTRCEWRRNGVQDVRMWGCCNRPVLQVNDQIVFSLGADLAPMWEARVKPYVYGVACIADEGPVFVGTAGNGGGLYALDGPTGAALADVRLRGGAWDPQAIDGEDLVASSCGAGLAVANGRTGQVKVVEIPHVERIAGSRGGRVFVLSGGTSPALHVVDVNGPA